MKKKNFLSIIGAIALVMTFTACLKSGTTTVEVDGKSYSVDTFVVAHYTETQVGEALKRAEAQKNIVRPTDASSFGAKKAEVCWVAFDNDLKYGLTIHTRKVGTVFVVHYEKGLEIIKDGQHWFYDGFPWEGEWKMWRTTASIAILDRPRWEPTDILFTDIGVQFEYLYTKNFNEWESWIMNSVARDYYGIKDEDDIILSYKKY